MFVQMGDHRRMSGVAIVGGWGWLLLRVARSSATARDACRSLEVPGLVTAKPALADQAGALASGGWGSGDFGVVFGRQGSADCGEQSGEGG